MKKVIVIPDSFKSSMSSSEVCNTISGVFKRLLPDCEVISVPVADGGEGSVDCFLQAIGGKKKNRTVNGPFLTRIDSFYGVLPDNTAVIEMAAAAGLPLVEARLEVGKTSTYGVGELIKAALDQGCNRLIVGMGGSATNDGGAGAACAMGVRFLDKNGHAFIPTGDTLSQIEKIDMHDVDRRIQRSTIVAMCDVDNPLCGPNGAAAVFSPQKGADESMIPKLDDGLAHLADIIRRDIGMDIKDLPGAGAAGGLGGGMVAFFNAKLQSGIETVLDMVNFDEMIRSADLVISGEGKLDEQSLRGKVVIGVAGHAKKQGVPVVAIVGNADIPLHQAKPYGISAVFSINRLAVPFSQSRARSKENLAETLENMLEFYKVFGT